MNSRNGVIIGVVAIILLIVGVSGVLLIGASSNDNNSSSQNISNVNESSIPNGSYVRNSVISQQQSGDSQSPAGVVESSNGNSYQPDSSNPHKVIVNGSGQ